MKCDYKDIKVDGNTIVTIGNFDGVHTGHRFLINKIKEAVSTTGGKTVILTFSPHPQIFLGIGDFSLITTDNEKAKIFDCLGVDYKIFADFNQELASLSPIDFVQKVLAYKLNCERVIVGENYRFGKNRVGDVALLTRLCEPHGIRVDIFKSIVLDGEAASSNRVRKCLREGDIEGANNILSYPYFIIATVIHGESIGRTLGFPTINLGIDEHKLLPKSGVYFTITEIDGTEYNGITNVGTRPTFGGVQKSVETFLFDYNDDAYGKAACVRFLKRSRDEQRFGGADYLKEAILLDKLAAKEYFNETTFAPSFRL